MYFNNDSVRQKTGLSSRTLSQLILLLLTTLTGRESSPAACHFSVEGGMREEMNRERKEQLVCFPVYVHLFAGLRVCTHASYNPVLIVIFCT